MRKSCFVGKVLLVLLVVYVFSLGKYVQAAYYPVYPWTSIPTINQDEGCIGAGIDDPKREKFDSCFVADRIHDGVDFVQDLSVPNVDNVDTYEIRAVALGTVIFADGTKYCFTRLSDCHHGFGNIVVVKRDDGKYEGYPHLETDKVYVKQGARVSPGTPLGRMGKTGVATGIHLHYVVWDIDPRIDLNEPLVTVRYKETHPSNYHIIDPWTVLGTATSKILHIPVTTARVNIRRGPGKKYSVFAQAVQTQNFMAFAHATATDDDGTYRWYRIDLPCTSESSCAGWIREDAAEIETWDPMSTPQDTLYQTGGKQILYLNSNIGAVNVRSIPTIVGNTPLGSVTGDQAFGIAFPPQTGDKTTCLCWFPLVTPEYVSNKQHFSWICGGIPSGEGITIPSCPNAKAGSTVTQTPDLSDITLAGAIIPYTPNPEEDPIVPPPPTDPVPSPPPYIPPGASLTATTADSPMQMETLVQGGVQGTASHTANVWLEYGASATSVAETVHRSVSAGSFSETFDLALPACGTSFIYRGVAELAATDIISYGAWKNASTLPCPVAPSTTPFAITVTPSCPDGVTATERITWEDQQAAQYEVYMDGVRANDVIYQVAVGTTHTFLVKAYFSNGTSLFSKSLTYALDKNPCTGPVFPAMEIPAYDLSADTFIADLLDPVYIQKLGGSATTLDPNTNLRLYTATWGDTGSVETKILPFDPALPLVMERQVMVSNLDKSPCFLSTNTGQSFGVVHVVKAAGAYCGSGRAPSATFHAGEVNSLACGLDLYAAIPTGSPFRELFLFEPTGHAYLFINGTLSAMANLPPLAPHATELSLYCHAERSAGGEVTSDYWYLWQEGGGTQKSLTAGTTREPTPALAEQAPEPIAEPVLDATISASNTTASNTLSFSHASSGTNRLLVVTVSTAADVESVRSITYDNLPLARAVGVDQMGRLSQIWYLLGQPTGAHTITISTAGSGRIIATALSFTGVAQTNVLGATATATGFDTTPTVDVQTKQQGSILIDSLVLNFESGSPVATKVQIVRSNLKGYSGIQHATSTKMGGGAGTHTMSWVSSGMWGISTAEFKAVVP